MKIRTVGAEFFPYGLTDRWTVGETDTQTEGSTDRRDEDNSRLSQFCDRA